MSILNVTIFILLILFIIYTRNKRLIATLVIIVLLLFIYISIYNSILSLHQNPYIDQYINDQTPLLYRIFSILLIPHFSNLYLMLFIISAIMAILYKFDKIIEGRQFYLNVFSILTIVLIKSVDYLSLLERVSFNTNINPTLYDTMLYIHPNLVYLSIGLISYIILHFLIDKTKSYETSERLRVTVLSVVVISYFALILGAYWAYHVLGWGSFWFWDPVEMICLMQFIISILILHIIKFKRDEKLNVNYTLFLLIAFIFTITYPRFFSVNSVHSFIGAESSILLFYIIVLLLTILLNKFYTGYHLYSNEQSTYNSTQSYVGHLFLFAMFFYLFVLFMYFSTVSIIHYFINNSISCNPSTLAIITYSFTWVIVLLLYRYAITKWDIDWVSLFVIVSFIVINLSIINKREDSITLFVFIFFILYSILSYIRSLSTRRVLFSYSNLNHFVYLLYIIIFILYATVNYEFSGFVLPFDIISICGNQFALFDFGSRYSIFGNTSFISLLFYNKSEFFLYSYIEKIHFISPPQLVTDITILSNLIYNLHFNATIGSIFGGWIFRVSVHFLVDFIWIVAILVLVLFLFFLTSFYIHLKSIHWR